MKISSLKVGYISALLTISFLQIFISIDSFAQTPSWSSAANLSSAGQPSYEPFIALSPDGTRAAATWTRSNGAHNIVQSAIATISGNTASWGSVTDHSATMQSAGSARIAISSDGTMATAVWNRYNGAAWIIQTASATISGNTATWSAAADLSANGQNSYYPQVVLSSDGTKATAIWQRWDGAAYIVQSASATISGNTATWGATTPLSTAGQSATNPQIAMTGDGTKATAVWSRSNGTNLIVQSASASISGNTATWASSTDITPTGKDGNYPQLTMSSDGTKVTVVWVENSGAKDIVQAASGVISGSSATWGSISDLSNTAFDANEPQVDGSSDGTKVGASWRLNDGTNFIVQAAFGSVSNTTATWAAGTSLSVAGQDARIPNLLLSSDGTRVTAMWYRFSGLNNIVQSTSGSLNGTTVTWGSTVDVSALGQDATEPNLKLSSDGALASAVWLRYDGSNDILQSGSASISYPTPTATPTPDGTSTPAATPTATSTPVVADTTPPSVTARKSRGTAGKKLILKYLISDDSGQSGESIRILKGKKRLKRVSVALSSIPGDGIRTKRVKSPLRIPGRLRYCVTATDAAGNSSSESCAAAVIK